MAARAELAVGPCCSSLLVALLSSTLSSPLLSPLYSIPLLSTPFSPLSPLHSTPLYSQFHFHSIPSPPPGLLRRAAHHSARTNCIVLAHLFPSGRSTLAARSELTDTQVILLLAEVLPAPRHCAHIEPLDGVRTCVTRDKRRAVRVEVESGSLLFNCRDELQENAADEPATSKSSGVHRLRRCTATKTVQISTWIFNGRSAR
eukprot:TRINITY_DN5756_c0_g3_i3.p1 TRINITY_DN5756_c0_g3~~TRINITY_DN5756_c0_g3_i3.p1  ORF type:complete len:202 (-),score=21.63 TRINITY_DN5756_c0_g3_i3:11-616(-)